METNWGRLNHSHNVATNRAYIYEPPPDYCSPEELRNMAGLQHNQIPPSLPDNPPRRAPPENKLSLLLSDEENKSILNILGKGRQVSFFYFTACLFLEG